MACKNLDESPGSSFGIKESGMDVTSAINEEVKPTDMKKTKILCFFKKKWADMKNTFAEIPGLPLQPSNVPDPKHQLKKELSELEKYTPQSLMQLLSLLAECKLSWTPVTEVWPRVFVGNEETARDQATLKKMGITHILNATSLEDMPSRKEYYQSLDISYYHVAVVDEAWFYISEFFYLAAEFIHVALKTPENKVLVHCNHGVSCSATLCLAYMMIDLHLLLEKAIDLITCVRRIEPNIGFLKQLSLLNSDLIKHQKLQLQNQIKEIQVSAGVTAVEQEPSEEMI